MSSCRFLKRPFTRCIRLFILRVPAPSSYDVWICYQLSCVYVTRAYVYICKENGCLACTGFTFFMRSSSLFWSGNAWCFCHVLFCMWTVLFFTKQFSSGVKLHFMNVMLFQGWLRCIISSVFCQFPYLLYISGRRGGELVDLEVTCNPCNLQSERGNTKNACSNCY